MAIETLDPHVEKLLTCEKVSSIVFILDYTQVVFHDYTTINLYSPVTIRRSGSESRSGSSGFADALVSFKGLKVSSVALEASEFTINFGPDSISVSLEAESYVGPEALCILGCDNSVWAW